MTRASLIQNEDLTYTLLQAITVTFSHVMRRLGSGQEMGGFWSRNTLVALARGRTRCTHVRTFPGRGWAWRLLLMVDATSARCLSSFCTPHFDAFQVYNHNCTIIEPPLLLNYCTATSALQFFRFFKRICKQLHPLPTAASRRVAPACTGCSASSHHIHYTFFNHALGINDWQVALRHVRIQDRPNS
jgi:hypothetical protein